MMRSTEQRLVRLVCAEHCRYFKPWATPEPDCGSMQWLLKLVAARPEVLDALERLRGRHASLPLVQDRLLLRRVCTPCQHYPDNCAYRKSARSPSAEPCGGLLVLDLLLGDQLLSGEDLFAAAAPPERHSA